ncbi:auxin-responsive protein IAA32-like isoform X2 [Andrographis paniculata]|uniref:auxin-responsive protein IAA32-like isoform X2 n=1 Tax=Andrographis paniculata TaxID=175694 RepID=UPI0021E855BC|nr:auxin-responsive protein IAA32-like isoform X2 [Andrographis paniculata]
MMGNGIKCFLSSLSLPSLPFSVANFNFLSEVDDNYFIGKEDSNMIDLGLSLKVLQSNACYSSLPHGNYEDLAEWHQPQPGPERTARLGRRNNIKERRYGEDEESDEGIQSKRRWTYVKVNMDGMLIGRKVCIYDYMDYLSLAGRLEDMFGQQTMSSLRLFEPNSQFGLLYKNNGDEQWRTVGEVPWKTFFDNVRRLRIACKNEPSCNIVCSSSAPLNIH